MRGTPAGITTISQPTNESCNCSLPTNALTLHLVSMWLKSAPTPLVWLISYKDNSLTKGECFNNNDNG